MKAKQYCISFRHLMYDRIHQQNAMKKFMKILFNNMNHHHHHQQQNMKHTTYICKIIN